MFRHCRSFVVLFLVIGILSTNVFSQIDVNPLAINIGQDRNGQTSVGLGSKWNFFGNGFNTGSVFDSTGYQARNLISGGPFNLGSFWGIGRRR